MAGGQERPIPDAVVRAMDGAAHPSLLAYILATFYGGGAAADYDEGVRANLLCCSGH